MSLLHTSVTGTGDTILFIHGFMEDASIFTEILPEFSDHTCITIDLFGHGKSFFDESLPPAVSTMAEQVIETITSMGMDEYAVVGHSLGGYVGLELLKKDTRVNQLVLFHSHPWEDSDEKKRDRERVIRLVQEKPSTFINEAVPGLFRNPQRNHQAVEEYKKIASRMKPSAIAWAAAAMKDRDSNVNIMLEKPGQCAVISGKHDKVVPVEMLRKLTSEAGIALIELPEDAHMSQAEHPATAAGALRAILG